MKLLLSIVFLWSFQLSAYPDYKTCPEGKVPLEQSFASAIGYGQAASMEVARTIAQTDGTNQLINVELTNLQDNICTSLGGDSFYYDPPVQNSSLCMAIEEGYSCEIDFISAYVCCQTGPIVPIPDPEVPPANTPAP